MTNLASNALTSLGDVKESLGIASSDLSWDNLIRRKINQASQQLETYCERTFNASDYTEEINGSGTDELVLNQRPVNIFTSLEYRGTAINSDNWISLNSNYYFVDTTAGILKLLFNAQGMHWNRWRATYNAGYTNIPSDLAEAANLLAAYYVNNPDGQIQIREKQEGQRRVMYYPGIKGFQDLMDELGIEQIINGYANWPLRSE